MNLSVDNDLLILEASFSRSPSAPDAICLLQVHLSRDQDFTRYNKLWDTSEQIINLPFGPGKIN
jgi:hypothetical protein